MNSSVTSGTGHEQELCQHSVCLGALFWSFTAQPCQVSRKICHPGQDLPANPRLKHAALST